MSFHRIARATLLSALACAAWRCGGTTEPVPTDATVDSTGDAPLDVGDGNACSPACGVARSCCGGTCINPANDPLNCGGCGVECTGATRFCDSGTCKATPCTKEGGTCASGTTCCGEECCTADQICCLPEGPLDRGPVCTTPTGSPATCPQGCAPLCVSDKNLKRDIVPVDDLHAEAVLEALAGVEVSTWSYASDPKVRHIGPMAQDLHQALGLGGSDKSYDPVDAHGLAFAGIRGLYVRMKALDARIDRLERENAKLRESCR